jgi:hypothetical protein
MATILGLVFIDLCRLSILYALFSDSKVENKAKLPALDKRVWAVIGRHVLFAFERFGPRQNIA